MCSARLSFRKPGSGYQRFSSLTLLVTKGMPFYFERGLCYRQDIAAVTSLGFVWNAWLSKRLFFFSRFRSRCFGSSSGFVGGGFILVNSCGYSASADVCGEFSSWHLCWNPGLPESPVSLHRCHFTRLSFLCASILSLYSIVGLLSFGLLQTWWVNFHS